jgi:3-methyladenine DNA glycosylase AlkC
MALEYMFLPDYVEQYGRNDFTISVNAMEAITQYTSCEFAVRPYLIQYPIQMMEQMQRWSFHPHHAVRRFASEGCRPRLPWAMGLPALKKNPSPILPILEELKNDAADFVRRSVANNLNDNAKDPPDLVIKLARKWMGKTAETDWVVKHGCRTLLKQGRMEVMQLFGYGNTEYIAINNLEITTPKVAIGQYLHFDFELHNTNSEVTKIRLEYAIYYQKANGTLSKKVYKISEKTYDAHSITPVQRKQSFKLITTRKFHTGQHALAITVNGKEGPQHFFELLA